MFVIVPGKAFSTNTKFLKLYRRITLPRCDHLINMGVFMIDNACDVVYNMGRFHGASGEHLTRRTFKDAFTKPR